MSYTIIQPTVAQGRLRSELADLLAFRRDRLTGSDLSRVYELFRELCECESLEYSPDRCRLAYVPVFPTDGEGVWTDYLERSGCPESRGVRDLVSVALDIFRFVDGLPASVWRSALGSMLWRVRAAAVRCLREQGLVI